MNKFMFRIMLLSSLSACEMRFLASEITQNLVEIKAKQKGKFCYTNENSDKFCLYFKGKVK